jgi:hypothetical protein
MFNRQGVWVHVIFRALAMDILLTVEKPILENIRMTFNLNHIIESSSWHFILPTSVLLLFNPNPGCQMTRNVIDIQGRAHPPLGKKSHHSS